MSEKTVSVKGTVYYKRTGMPLHLERGEQHTKNAQQVHHVLQKSKTLNRKYVKLDKVEPVHIQSTPQPIVAHTISAHRPSVTPHVVTPVKGVTHFTSTAAPVHHHKVISDIGPAPHALAINASRKLAKAPVQTLIKPSQIIKQEAIAKAMAKTPAKSDRQETPPSRHPKMKRFAGLATASFAILMLGGYFTYLSMPSISTRVAASQAGIAASYPNYQPTGYSLSGAVAYQQGRVTMTFAANAGPSTYTLEQTKSGWDSSAVLDSYVKPKAGDNYETTTSNGLTIYTYDGSAAWVNRGIFYTISGDAPLSDDQIQRIATSL
jgi:hypothetical protein